LALGGLQVLLTTPLGQLDCAPVAALQPVRSSMFETSLALAGGLGMVAEPS
jgi:hypothetical protein